MKNYPYIRSVKLLKSETMEQNFNNMPCHCGVAQVVGVALNRTIQCEGPMTITDEETRKHFTDDNGVLHSVVFIDPNTGERRFGG